MSHIDSFKHEIVGMLGGLPVYHPLEDIDGDFRCTKMQLVIGGGSGEHPALVIDSPVNAVAWYLFEELNKLKKVDVKSHDCPLKKHVESWLQIIDPYVTSFPDDVLKFYDWRIEDYANFRELCMSVALPNPSDGKHIEMWLVTGIGEFVFYSMPDLANEIMGKIDVPEKMYHMNYNNILVIPPNIPVYSNGGNAFKFSRKNET